MFRNIDSILVDWKNDNNRKVLLLRGARQVGKTYSVRNISKKFKYYIEINFEENFEIQRFFEGNLDTKKIIEKLSLYAGKPVLPGETLIFFDEIQSCSNALRSLRFFYEKHPELHIIAAGSLLEFVINEIPSFGVGRIQSIFMYPMTFDEYLHANKMERFIPLIKQANVRNPIDPVFHRQILEYLKTFMIIGGMPEVVETYYKTGDFAKSQIILENLITSIFDDFAKYKKRAPVLKIREVFNSIINQTGNKFKYSNVGMAKSIQYKEALDLLVNAGLAYKIFHTSANGLPLLSQINEKKFKILLFDTGIFQRISGLNLQNYVTSSFEEIINKGPLTELYAGLTLLQNQSPYLRPQLFYWHREAKSSNAEVDYIISKENEIIPIEVKSGQKGQMQSMRLFLQEKQYFRGIRSSHENFSQPEDKIETIPLYALPYF